MNYIKLFLFISLLSSNLFGQQDSLFIKYKTNLTSDRIMYKTDTIVFNSEMARHYLIGTTIIPWTQNQMNAKGWGINFNKVTKSDCQKSGEEIVNMSDKIINVSETDSSYIVDLNIIDNCCYDFLCDISVDRMGTLNLIYTGYGTHCGCECCFGLTYHIEKMFASDLGEIKGIKLNGDEKTRKEIK